MINQKEIAIIIPSYNEVKNVPILIERIKKELNFGKIIIVDDSKPSENQKLKKIVKSYRNIILISRLKKAGRGSAVIEGFKEALRYNINFMFEMDSDLAHDPKEFKRFLDKANSEHFDLIIGSRYLPGGKIVNITADRTIMSRVINKFLYYWLGIHLTDHTSGFRLYNRKAINFITKTKIHSTGFITLSEIAYKIYRKGFKIAEVPITWNYRIYGKSNVNLNELIRSLLFVVKLKFIS